MIRNSSKTKNRLYKHFCEETSQREKETLHNQFKIYQNYLVILMRNSKASYFAKYFEDNKKDNKNVWKAIRNIVNVKRTNKFQPTTLVTRSETQSRFYFQSFQLIFCTNC